MKALSLLLAMLLASPALAQLRLGGIAELASAVQTSDGKTQKTELSLLPNLQWRGPVDVTAIARIRADALDRIEPGIPQQSAIAPGSRRALGRQVEAELRELYADMYWGENYLRIGKQQIVWGQSDGLKVLDRVNPQSFREFILADFEDSRIPLWSLKWERPLGEHINLQLIYLPDQSYHELPAADAVFAIRSPELVPATGEQPLLGFTSQRPNRRFADADAGLQLGSRLQGWDLTFNYFYHYADTPALSLLTVDGGVIAQARYQRSHTTGMSATNAIGDFTLRAELGYSSALPIPAAAPSTQQATVSTGEFAYVLGLDWMGISDTLISAQLFQSRIHAPAVRGAVETDFTLLLERTWLNQVLRLRMLAIHDLDSGDGVISPALRYQLRSKLELGLEADVFYGSARGRFGQFDQRDRLVLISTFSF